MPDLNQIKQAEQEAPNRRGRPAEDRSVNPAGGPRGCRDHVDRAARLLLAGRRGADPQSRRAVSRDGNTGRQMKHPGYEHRGGCHCGNLALRLRLSQAPEDTPLRACGCSFCRAHNTRTASDPSGSVEIWAENWSLVEPYRFGSGTAEFLICRRCGVYIGAVCETTAGTRAVINTNCLEDRTAFNRHAVAVNHESEGTEERLARRGVNWTPAHIRR